MIDTISHDHVSHMSFNHEVNDVESLEAIPRPLTSERAMANSSVSRCLFPLGSDEMPKEEQAFASHGGEMPLEEPLEMSEMALAGVVSDEDAPGDFEMDELLCAPSWTDGYETPQSSANNASPANDVLQKNGLLDDEAHSVQTMRVLFLVFLNVCKPSLQVEEVTAGNVVPFFCFQTVCLVLTC